MNFKCIYTKIIELVYCVDFWSYNKLLMRNFVLNLQAFLSSETFLLTCIKKFENFIRQ